MFDRPLPSLTARHQFSPVTILQLDLEYNIKLWNPAAEQISTWRKTGLRQWNADQRGSLNEPR
jgi:hypothetical protein